jgi:hypothetical protein
VYLSKIWEERTLLINLLYNLALSDLKKSKKPFKLILVNLLQVLALSNLEKSKKTFSYTLNNLKRFKNL